MARDTDSSSSTVDFNNQTLLRKWLVSRLLALRIYASTLPEGGEIADRLRGEAGEKRAAKIIDTAMRELGYEIKTPVENSSNRIRREVAGVFGQSN